MDGKPLTCKLLLLWIALLGTLSAAGGAPLPLPPPTPPATRPVRGTIDVSDELACYRELAELASFVIALDQCDENHEVRNALAVERYPESPRLLDAAIRFDRLMESKNPEFIKLVESVRRIHTDSWRLSRGNDRFGWNWKQPATTGAEGLLSQAIATVASEAFDEFSAPHGEVHQYTDSSGQTHGYSDPNPPVEYSQRTAKLQDDLDHAMQRLAKNREDRDITAYTFLWIRGAMENELSRIWKQRILPPLMDKAGPQSAAALFALDSSACGYGFVNTSGKTLNHVTLVVTVKDDKGKAFDWYAYFPSFKAGRHGWLSYLPLSKLNQLSPHIEQIISVYCDEGRDVGRSARLPAVTDRGLARIKDPIDEDAALKKAPELLALLSEMYGAPRNPDVARARLLASLRPGQVYQAKVELATGSVVFTLKFDPIKNSYDLVHAEDTNNLGDESPSGRLIGKFIEETDRGCVIGLISTATRIAENHQKARAHAAPPLVDARLAGLARAALERAKSQDKRDEPALLRLGRIITSPTEMQDYYVPGALETMGPPGAHRSWFLQQISNAPFTHYATYVIFANQKEQLWLQTFLPGHKMVVVPLLPSNVQPVNAAAEFAKSVAKARGVYDYVQHLTMNSHDYVARDARMKEDLMTLMKAAKALENDDGKNALQSPKALADFNTALNATIERAGALANQRSENEKNRQISRDILANLKEPKAQ